MSEPFVGSEMSEELEGTEALSREMQELNEITNEPGSYIEGKIDVSQSEAIESSFNELVNAALENPDSLDETLPVLLPKEGPEASIDPRPIWKEVDEVDKVSPGGEGDISEASGLPIPIPVPMPLDAGEGELSTAEPADTLAEVLPIPVPGEMEEINMDPNPFSRETGEVDSSPHDDAGNDMSIDPIPIWREAEEGVTTVEFNVAGEVAATFNGTTVSLIGENG